MGDVLGVIAVFVLVLLNAFFVAAEFAIVKVRGTRVAELAADGVRRARVADHLVQHLDAYLSATQLGITMASLGLGWVGEPALSHLIEPPLTALGIASPATLHATSAILAFGVITFLHIVIGELAPKSLAIRKSEGTTLWIAYPLRAFYIVFRPVIWFFNGAANMVLRMIKLTPANESELAHSEEELRMILTASQQGGHIDESLVDHRLSVNRGDHIAGQQTGVLTRIFFEDKNDPEGANLGHLCAFRSRGVGSVEEDADPANQAI